MAKGVTRDMVAKRAGVSPAVVSYVVNGSGAVSEEKRRRVQQAIDELGYYPNLLARGLKTSKSAQIAFVCDNIDGEWLGALEELLFQKGYYVSVLYSRRDEQLLRMLVQRQYEGAFLLTNIFTTAQLNTLAQSMPIVLYKTRSYGALGERIATVAPNYYDGVTKALEYLILKGHRRIALIPPLRYQTTGITGDDFRVRAYVEVLERGGLPIDDALVCKTTDSVPAVQNCVFNMLTAMGEQRPTGLVVGNDYLAARLLQFIHKMGLRVPEDVAIIGADNTAFAEITAPALTSVDYSKTALTEAIADRLLALIRGEPAQHVLLDVGLILRESA